MPQTCTVCAHPQTKAIEKEIVQGRANTRIADEYGLDHQAVRYHKMNHLPDKLVRSVQKNQQKHAENILDGIKDLLQRTRNILDQAEDKGQNSLALNAIKEARSTYELLSKIAVKLEEYRRQDEEKETGMLEQQASQGLQALSDTELKAYIQLQAKIFSADPDYDLDPKVRMFVDGVNRTRSYDAPGDASKIRIPRRNRSRQDKNTQKHSSEDDNLELDDLDDFELEDLDLSNEIPSEESDPDWLREERRRNR